MNLIKIFSWKTVVVMLCVTLLGWSVSISQSKVGTTAAQFLGISIGAREIAMGGTSVATAGGVSSIYYNPGAFVQAHKTEIIVSQTDWLVNTKMRWLGAMLSLSDADAVGLSITQLSYGDEPVTTEDNPEGTGENWSAQDFAVAVSYARSLTDKFSIGGSCKYVSQTIWHESASTFAFDVGLLFITGFKDMRLGMSISNFGGDLKMEGADLAKRIDIDPGNAGSNKLNLADLKTDPWPIPLLFRVGLAMDVVKNEMTAITLECDAMRPSDNVEVVNIGAETMFMDLVSLRVGYKSLFNKDSEEGLTLGIGIKYDVPGQMGFELNYANQSFGRFGNLNTFSVGVRF